MMQLFLVEDNPKLRPALTQGLEATGEVKVCGASASGEDALQQALALARPDEDSPLALLEPNEREVARMVALGMTNEQIAARMGFRDKRTISRVNGQIYTSWGLNDSSTDEKVARLRAALIYHHNRFIE